MTFPSATRRLGPVRGLSTWLGIAAGALAVNLGLFALMPYLLDTSDRRPVFESLIPQVRVIRLPRPETPVEHRRARLPDPPPPEPVTAPAPSRKVVKPLPADLKLDFAIEPRLVGGPVVAETPPMKIATFAPVAPPSVVAETPPMKIATLAPVAPPSVVVEAGALDRPLTVLSRIEPRYPFGAKRRGVEGWVKVRFEIDEQGAVRRVEVVAAEPEGVFDRNVVDCIRRWRFKPGTVEGVPVRARAETTVRFELE